MMLKKLETPLNKLGFVVFCLSVMLCVFAFLVTYRTSHHYDSYWLAHLVLDRSYDWQQSVFKLGLAGAAFGATLAWNYLALVKRVYHWVWKV
ncbi:hypothetical protein [Pseudomonas sp. dw_612]|uniref:hypothetical protein n=1 Tax=Pseudomonas sp. dw_612 TaxID=2720080 RepID=UPI001BD2D95D|nr:hypothetical protein [Pseudomonas sp. dw_612]